MNERDVSLCALWGSGKWFNINPKCHQYDTDFEAFMYEFSLFTTSNSNACTDTQNLVWIIRAKQNEFKVGLKGQSPSDPRKPLHASHVWKTLLQPSVHYILLNCNIYMSSTSISVHPLFLDIHRRKLKYWDPQLKGTSSRSNFHVDNLRTLDVPYGLWNLNLPCVNISIRILFSLL